MLRRFHIKSRLSVTPFFAVGSNIYTLGCALKFHRPLLLWFKQANKILIKGLYCFRILRTKLFIHLVFVVIRDLEFKYGCWIPFCNCFGAKLPQYFSLTPWGRSKHSAFPRAKVRLGFPSPNNTICLSDAPITHNATVSMQNILETQVSDLSSLVDSPLPLPLVAGYAMSDRRGTDSAESPARDQGKRKSDDLGPQNGGQPRAKRNRYISIAW